MGKVSKNRKSRRVYNQALLDAARVAHEETKLVRRSRDKLSNDYRRLASMVVNLTGNDLSSKMVRYSELYDQELVRYPLPSINNFRFVSPDEINLGQESLLEVLPLNIIELAIEGNINNFRRYVSLKITGNRKAEFHYAVSEECLLAHNGLSFDMVEHMAKEIAHGLAREVEKWQRKRCER